MGNTETTPIRIGQFTKITLYTNRLTQEVSDVIVPHIVSLIITEPIVSIKYIKDVYGLSLKDAKTIFDALKEATGDVLIIIEGERY